MILIPWFYPELSVKDAVKYGKDEASEALLKRVYIFESENNLQKFKSDIYHEVTTASADTNEDMLSLWEGFTSKKYRRSSITSAFITTISQWGGMPIIILYSVNVFGNMKKAGKFDIPLVVAVNALNLINMIASFSANIFTPRIGLKNTIVMSMAV